MKYVSAYMLAALGGKTAVTLSDIENILGSVGIDCDQVQADTLIKKMGGKSIETLISEGAGHLCSTSAAPAASAAPASDAKAASAAPVEEKKEEKKEEKEESDEDMGFGLFD